jgi:hypothetical protein
MFGNIWSKGSIAAENERYISDYYEKRFVEQTERRSETSSISSLNEDTPLREVLKKFGKDTMKELSEGVGEVVTETKATMKIRDTAPQEYEEVLRRIYGVCAHRRLFVTSKGYFGLAPWNAAVDDTIAVFKGSKTPFALRSDLSRNHVYSMIGEAYVFGIMAGETFDLCPEVACIGLV